MAVSSANIRQQCLKAGLLDEIQIDRAPVLLGGGVRLFDHLGIAPIQLESTGVIERLSWRLPASRIGFAIHVAIHEGKLDRKRKQDIAFLRNIRRCPHSLFPDEGIVGQCRPPPDVKLTANSRKSVSFNLISSPTRYLELT